MYCTLDTAQIQPPRIERYNILLSYTLKIGIHILHYSSALQRTASFFTDLINESRPMNMTDFFRIIEKSDTKDDFKVGIEARYFFISVMLSPLRSYMSVFSREL